MKKNLPPIISWSKTKDDIYDEEGEVIGSKEYILIDLVYVPPKLRRQGVAKKLLKNELIKMKKKGLPIFLAALPKEKDIDMDQLVEFYERMGFCVDEESLGGATVIMEYMK